MHRRFYAHGFGHGLVWCGTQTTPRHNYPRSPRRLLCRDIGSALYNRKASWNAAAVSTPPPQPCSKTFGLNRLIVSISEAESQYSLYINNAPQVRAN